MKKLKSIATVLGLLASAGLIRAGNFSANFDDGNPPAGTAVFGTTVVETTGGVNNSGALKITKALNSQSGSFVIEDFDGGAPVYGFNSNFKVRLGGGTAAPADGFSFIWASNVPDGPWAEEGTGDGLTVTFDLYDNGAAEAPSIDVKWNGVTLGSTKFTIPGISTTNDYADVSVNLHPNGFLDMAFKGSVLYTNLPVPGFTSFSGARFGFGGRTGGANANQFVDNLQITTVNQSQVGILSQPQSQTMAAGFNTVLKVGVNNPEGVTYQWFRNGVLLNGETSASLALNNLNAADSGVKYRVEVRGPNNTVQSQEAALTIVQVTPQVAGTQSYNFNDATQPSDTQIFGTGYINVIGGVGDSGVVVLTDAQPNENASFIVNDFNAGAPVTGFTAQFKVRVGGGSTPPADGFSFNFASDLPDNTFGNAEEGTGTGLSVGFDIYDNGGGEAPSVDIKYGGRIIQTTKVPLSLIETGDSYAPVLIQLNNDGTLDVIYNGVLLANKLPVPGFSSISGGRFGFAGRTGGSTENIMIDDIVLGTTSALGPLHFVTAPAATTNLVGKTATFTSSVNLTNGVSFQWFKNGTPVGGASGATFTTPVLTVNDDQSKYKVVATGPGGTTITSSEVQLTVANLFVPPAPKLSLNFDNGTVPPGAALYGTGIIDITGGVNNTGVLKLTTNANSLNSSFVIAPLEGGAEVAAFTASFDLLLGGGTATPADGFSFNFASDFPDNTIGDAEEGSGTGLTVTFDIYDNAGGEAPSIDVKYKAAVVASTKFPITALRTGDAYTNVIIRLNQDATFDLSYGDRVVYYKLPIPGFTPISNGKFAFAGRTGGLNENMWIDNLAIATAKPVGPLRIVTQPQSTVVLNGQTATFNVLLSDPVGATYQWFLNGNPIANATGASYTTGALTTSDSGSRISVRATGPGGTVSSSEALLTVAPAITVTNPKLNADFNDALAPAGTEVSGVAFVDAVGGVNDSGVLKLTTAANDQTGGYTISDLDAGAAVSGFTARFNVLIGGGTTPPADGFSFVWANDVPLGTGFGEDGAGTGLVVSFDIYDNGGGEAPALDVRYGGVTVASTQMPLSTIQTSPNFVPVIIRAEADGTLDLVFNNKVIYYNLPLPGYKALAGGSFIFGARTGGLNANQWVDDLAISTSTGAAAPQMSISQDGTGVHISWTGAGTLQSSANVTGLWGNVTGSSPVTVQPTDAHRFFRVLSQ